MEQHSQSKAELEPLDQPGLLRAFSGLQSKATILVVALTMTVTVAVSGYLLRTTAATARTQQELQMIEVASLISRASAGMMYKRDAKGLVDLAEELANGSPLLFVVFADIKGHVLAKGEHTHISSTAVVLQHREQDRASIGQPIHYAGDGVHPSFFRIDYPVTWRGISDGRDVAQLVGYARIGMSVEEWERTISGTMDMLSGVGVIAVAVAIPIGFLLVRRLIKPLQLLAGSMQSFSEGKLDVRSNVKSLDEIGDLALTFNRMADQHQRTHRRLVKLNAELEERVSKRTRQLRELASREPLTGLYNRRHFNEVLDRAFSEALRYEGDLACIMIDLDEFKKVNDQLGHQAGDGVLLCAATTIRSQLRGADLAARYGGDEFVVLLPQTNTDRAYVLAERIGGRFAEEMAHHDPPLSTGMSMGIASLTGLKSRTPDELVRAADRALYRAKAEGKNCIASANLTPHLDS